MDVDVIYYKDARYMTEVEDNSITLIVTSPPYWNIKDYSLDGYQEQVRTDKIEGQIGDIDDYQEYLKQLTEVRMKKKKILKLKIDFKKGHRNQSSSAFAQRQLLVKAGGMWAQMPFCNRLLRIGVEDGYPLFERILSSLSRK